MSLIAEVPLLQIFDSDIGDITWIKLLIAVLSVLCLCSALLDLSLVLHKTVRISIPIRDRIYFFTHPNLTI